MKQVPIRRPDDFSLYSICATDRTTPAVTRGQFDLCQDSNACHAHGGLVQRKSRAKLAISVVNDNGHANDPDCFGVLVMRQNQPFCGIGLEYSHCLSHPWIPTLQSLLHLDPACAECWR